MAVWFPSEGEKYTGASQKGVVASGELYNSGVEWRGVMVFGPHRVPAQR